mmetsp:Transcript_20944/g.58282  ORF Transcript_20944/g.58282 Transcript_20944/m.58282 type:complete len:185 (+) Transcript_20944:255-809(+)
MSQRMNLRALETIDLAAQSARQTTLGRIECIHFCVSSLIYGLPKPTRSGAHAGYRYLGRAANLMVVGGIRSWMHAGIRSWKHAGIRSWEHAANTKWGHAANISSVHVTVRSSKWIIICHFASMLSLVSIFDIELTLRMQRQVFMNLVIYSHTLPPFMPLFLPLFLYLFIEKYRAYLQRKQCSWK